MPVKLSFYIAQQFAYFFGVILSIAAVITLIFDSIEIVRSMPSGTDLPLWTLATLALLRNYSVLHNIMPLLILLASTITYSALSVNREIVAISTLGLSPTQTVIPAVTVLSFWCLIHILLLNPLSAFMMDKYYEIGRHYWTNRAELVSLSDSGIWIKKGESQHGFFILNASKVAFSEEKMHNVRISRFLPDWRLIDTIYTQELTLKQEHWVTDKATMIPNATLKVGELAMSPASQQDPNVVFTTPAIRGVNSDSQAIPITDLSVFLGANLEQLYRNLVSPDTLSIFQIPHFLSLARQVGLPTREYEYHFYRSFLFPTLFLAMLLLGAIYGNIKVRSSYFTAVKGIVIGFPMFFANDIASAMLAKNYSIATAALIPGVLSLLCALYLWHHHNALN